MAINIILIPNDTTHLSYFFFNPGSVREYAVFLDKEHGINQKSTLACESN